MRAVPLLAIFAFGGCTAGTIVEQLEISGDNGDNSTPADAAVRPATPDGAVKRDAGVLAPDAVLPPDETPDAAVATGPTPTFDVTELSRNSILSIAEASVGYTYWWGHGSLGGTMAGTCTGSCPSCTHTGLHGADCSGFVGKAWMLPEAMPIVGADEHPYSTYTFSHYTYEWTNISRSDVEPGDAMVYNINGSGHIFLYEKDDPWGEMWTYEARGCAYGIVHNIRTAGSQFNAIRRDGL